LQQLLRDLKRPALIISLSLLISKLRALVFLSLSCCRLLVCEEASHQLHLSQKSAHVGLLCWCLHLHVGRIVT
jgi:hypothetical protein